MPYHDKKSLGQNFIKYPSLVRELVNSADINKNDLIVEIGPGKGVITSQLATRAKMILGIEKDENLANDLRVKFNNFDNVKIINQDFLDYELPRDEYKVFSNIPFSITSEIVNKLLLAQNMPKEIYLILQLEAAEKFKGIPKETQSSVLTKPFYEIEILGDIDRTNFTLKPQVKIVFTKFSKRAKPYILEDDKVDFRNFVIYGFNQWKPTISEAFKKVFTHPQIITLEKMHKIVGKKPSEVSFDTWLILFKTFKKIGNEEGRKEIKAFEYR